MTINQADVLNVLYNLMGHRVAPGGTDDDLKRYIQQGFDYCWRYFPWTFSLKTATIAADGILPEDFDHEGWREFNGITEVPLVDTLATGNTSSAIIWNTATNRYNLTPAAAGSVAYQYTPPTLGTDADGSAPFPSARVVAMAALIYEKLGENPTRADVQQEWDMLHSELDRLAGRAYNNRPSRPRHYLDQAGTYVGDVGA